VPVPRTLRALMWIVIGVSIPEGLALLFGPSSWFPHIWIWGLAAAPLNPMTARFVGGIYLSVSMGFGIALKMGEQDWERLRLPIAMLWSFALIALVSALVSVATDPNEGTSSAFIHLDRPFTYVWFFLYAVSVVGGLYYHFVYPRKFGVRPW